MPRSRHLVLVGETQPRSLLASERPPDSIPFKSELWDQLKILTLRPTWDSIIDQLTSILRIYGITDFSGIIYPCPPDPNSEYFYIKRFAAESLYIIIRNIENLWAIEDDSAPGMKEWKIACKLRAKKSTKIRDWKASCRYQYQQIKKARILMERVVWFRPFPR